MHSRFKLKNNLTLNIMNKSEKFLITINRELGSGGGSVGRRLAERLDVKYFDKVILQSLKEKFHLTAEEIEKLKGQKEGWWAEFTRKVVPFQEPGVPEEPEIITTEDVYQTEVEILKGIASQESCVITGRSAFFVLRDHPNHLSIFIQAPMEQRIQRVMKEHEVNRAQAIKTIKQVDEMRENYVKRFANTTRYDTRNYDLVISMENLKIDDAVDIILDYVFRQNL